MVEPLLLTHALAGAQNTEFSQLHFDACLGTWFVPGKNIHPVHVQRSQLPSHITYTERRVGGGLRLLLCVELRR